MVQENLDNNFDPEDHFDTYFDAILKKNLFTMPKEFIKAPFYAGMMHFYIITMDIAGLKTEDERIEALKGATDKIRKYLGV